MSGGFAGTRRGCQEAARTGAAWNCHPDRRPQRLAETKGCMPPEDGTGRGAGGSSEAVDSGATSRHEATRAGNSRLRLMPPPNGSGVLWGESATGSGHAEPRVPGEELALGTNWQGRGGRAGPRGVPQPRGWRSEGHGDVRAPSA